MEVAKQGDYEHDKMAEIEAKVLAGEIPPDVARVVISSKQWRASKLAPKKYGASCKIIWNASHNLSQIEAIYLESIQRLSRQYSIFRFTVRNISI